MKKAIKSIAALFAALTLCLGLLAGCSAKSPAGTWEITSGEMFVSSVSADQFGDISSTTVVLNQDGTVEGGGSWKLDGSTLILNQEGVDFSCAYDGNTFTLDLGIAKAIYTRV